MGKRLKQTVEKHVEKEVNKHIRSASLASLKQNQRQQLQLENNLQSVDEMHLAQSPKIEKQKNPKVVAQNRHFSPPPGPVTPNIVYKNPLQNLNAMYPSGSESFYPVFPNNPSDFSSWEHHNPHNL